MESTELLGANEDGISRAASLLRSGQLVAFPTETVYGLGADARDDTAVAKVFEAKARPSFNPLIVHVSSLDHAKQIADFNDEAIMLAEAFWPGPLSLILPVRPNASISRLVTAGANTVAVRMPDASVARRLIETASCPVAAPSANPSGRISPTTAAHVVAGLGGKIAAIVDGGPCTVGLESTVVAPGNPTRLLRLGGLPSESLERCLGEAMQYPEAGTGPASPGQELSHYAPRAKLRMNASSPETDELFLGFGKLDGDENLSRSADLVEAAANLFRLLHALDSGGKPIAVAPIPDTGLGQAINDRLRRASHSR